MQAPLQAGDRVRYREYCDVITRREGTMRMHFIMRAGLACLGALLAVQAYGSSVIDHGAIADGATDCTTAFQRALDAAAAAGGGVVDVPAGRYALSGVLRIPAYVRLQGVTAGHAPSSDAAGSVLLTTAGHGEPDGPPFITLDGDNAAVAGFTIVYPRSDPRQVPPVPYPPAIGNTPNASNVAVLDMNVWNAYEGVRLVQAGRHLIRNLHGYPTRRGLFVDRCWDVGRVEQCHFWPYSISAFELTDAAAWKRVRDWVATHATAFEFARTDWEYVTGTFCYGYRIGYHLSVRTQGPGCGAMTNIGADCSEYGIYADDIQPSGWMISNGEFHGRAGSTTAVGVEIAPGCNGRLSLANCTFFGLWDAVIRMRAPKGDLMLNGCHLLNWDVGLRGTPAAQLMAGRALIANCQFGQGEYHVAVSSAVRQVSLQANQADGAFRVKNQAGSRLTAANNTGSVRILTRTELRAYRVDVGSDGDQEYIAGFWAQEGPEQATWRWTRHNSRINLPAEPGKPYRITVRVDIRESALMPGAGLYLNERLVIPVTRAGLQQLTGTLPPAPTGMYRLQWRVKPWIPHVGGDARELGGYLDWVQLQQQGYAGAVVRVNGPDATHRR